MSRAGAQAKIRRPMIDSPRRGLRREEAARFVGCVLLDVKKLDRALDNLDDDGDSSEWD